MNKTEARYSEHLTYCRRIGLLQHFAFHAVRLRLAKRLYYTPDFLVIVSKHPGIRVELHEVKTWWRGKHGAPGHPGWTEDSRVKIKAAAQLFPWFAFRAAVLRDGDWIMEEFTPLP